MLLTKTLLTCMSPLTKVSALLPETPVKPISKYFKSTFLSVRTDLLAVVFFSAFADTLQVSDSTGSLCVGAAPLGADLWCITQLLWARPGVCVNTRRVSLEHKVKPQQEQTSRLHMRPEAGRETSRPLKI